MTKKIKGIFPLEGISTGARSVSFEAEGYLGGTCQEATKSFEDAMGVTTNEELKDEFYRTEDRQEFNSEGGS